MFPSPTADPAAANIKVELLFHILSLLIQDDFIGFSTGYTSSVKWRKTRK